MADDKRILIAGGGLGGLTTALALRKAGFDPLVLEAAPRLLPYGSVLQLWPHGVQGLRAVGVGDDLDEKSDRIHALEFRNKKGRRLLRVSLEDVADSIAIGRGELHELLGRAVGDGGVRTGAKVVDLEQDEAGVTAKLADGSEERGIVLIGADGLDSTVRGLVAGPVEYRYVGKGWGGVANVPNPPMELGVSWNVFGRGSRVGLLHTRPNLVAWNTVLTVPEDEEIGGKDEALRHFGDWPAPVGDALNASPAEAFFVRSIKDFAPIEKWGEGRVTLLGDAAHATTPAQGRGVSEAVEDAIVLANQLAGAGDLSDGARAAAALRSYEDKRRPATAKVTAGSMRVMRMGVLKNPVKMMGRNTFFRVAGPMLGKKMTEDVHRTIEPLEAARRF